MAVSPSIRTTVRNLITQWGTDASLYSFSSATKTYNDEGEVTVSSWGTATAIKLISSNHFSLKRLLANQGEENDKGDRVMLIRDDVTVSARDKVTIGTDTYVIKDIKLIDPIENITIAKRIVLAVDARY